jgi:hypothetical protein
MHTGSTAAPFNPSFREWFPSKSIAISWPHR